MPTVESIARQISLTADVSSRIFRNDMEAARESTLIKGPLDTANDMISSGFGLRPNVTAMLGNYAEERENFTAEFDRTISSLRESADRVNENRQAREDMQEETRRRAQEAEHNRRESAERFAAAARERLQTNEQTRLSRAEEYAADNLDRFQTELQERHDNVDRYSQELRERFDNIATNNDQRSRQVAEAERERIQNQREQTERFARQYLVAENVERRNADRQAVNAIDSTRAENANAALANVRNMVNRFNDAVAYFNGNRDLSNRMNALAGAFNQMRNEVQALNETENIETASDLVTRLEQNIELATSQRDNLFTNVADYVNNERTEPAESLYTLQLNQTAAHAGQVNWRFLNMFT